MSKWFVLSNAINYNYLFSSIIGILFSAIGAGYYLRVIKIIYFQKSSSYKSWEAILKIKSNNNEVYFILLGVATYIIIFFIINPFPFIMNIHKSFLYFF
jgi:NADH:ubiquinone oxidoreductase subunit 2 (subunit N)